MHLIDVVVWISGALFCGALIIMALELFLSPQI